MAGDVRGPAGHDRRGARPADARQLRHRTSARSGSTSRRTRGLTFYQVLTLASIVEREAVARRRASRSSPASTRTGSTRSWPDGQILKSDPTIFYVNDTLAARQARLRPVAEVRLLGAARRSRCQDVDARRPSSPGYNTYTSAGLIPGPDRTPTLASIDAALGARHEGRLPVLRGQDRRRRHARLRQDQRRSIQRSCSRSTAYIVSRRPGRSPADFAAPPTPPTAPAGTRPTGPPGPARLARLRARLRRAGVDAYFGVRPEHMRYLTGLRARRRRGEGRRRLGPVPGRRRRGRRARRLALHDPGPPRGARRAARRGLRRPRGALAGARRARSARAGSRSRPASCSHAPGTRLAAAAPDVELVPVEGWVEADRAIKEPAELERDRRGLRGRRSGPGRAAARDPAGRDRGRARAAARVADADRRRRGARVRRRLPGRPRGGPAARLAGRPAGPRPGGPAVRLRRAGRRLSQRHDPDAVRRRARRRAISRSTSSSRAPRRRRSTALEAAARGRRTALPSGRAVDAVARDVIDGGRPRRALRPRHGPRHRPRDPRGAVPRPAGAGRRRCPARRSSRSSPGVYLDGEMGVRIEDLVALDVAARRLERLTRFPRDVIVVGG